MGNEPTPSTSADLSPQWNLFDSSKVSPVRYLITLTLSVSPIPVFYLMSWVTVKYPFIQRWEPVYFSLGVILVIGSPIVFITATVKLMYRLWREASERPHANRREILYLSAVALAYGGFCLHGLIEMLQFAAFWNGYRG